MPYGKPAGVRCIQLDDDDRCRLFGRPERPAVCSSLKPAAEMCGSSAEHALRFLETLERITRPVDSLATQRAAKKRSVRSVGGSVSDKAPGAGDEDREE